MSRKTEGVRIDHNYDELESGSSYIMVAKDTPLIDPSKGTILESQTELENVDLQAAHNQKVKLRLKEQAKRGDTYDPYRNAMEGKEGELYDQPGSRKEGISLDEKGQYDPNKVAQLAAIKQKLTKAKANEISLETPKVISSEYETPAPIKTKRKFAAIAQRRRKPEKEDIGDFFDKEERSRGNKETNDLSTKEEMRRKRQEEAEVKESGEQEAKSEKYKNAVKRAKKITADVYEEKDEYDEIEAALNRQRLARKRGEDMVHEIINEDNATEQQTSGNDKPSDETVMLTDTLNFISAVPSIKDRKEYNQSVVQNTNLSLKDTRDGRASVVNIPLPTERLRHLAPGYSSCVPTSFPSSAKPPEPEPAPQKVPEKEEKVKPVVEEENAPVPEPLNELLIGKGIGNALKLLRERKLLGQTLYSGRSKDPTKEKELDKFSKAGFKDGNNIDFDYRDETGHKMTLKEAWRYQCRIFHGLKPSKRKREKTMIKREKERKKLTMDQVKDSKLAQALTKTQQEKNTPYMVLDAKKPVIFQL
eukprot:TRINITY_DN123092_c1_g1_i1.p1 TRINITY_DN123092_c1_g1~~TRINITY_DN123092_c1_g1_i1.p1  ORF type:complete len:568 (-),score=108.92 TRINITY_DN123092_c1_g1_i1:89-1684(-)